MRINQRGLAPIFIIIAVVLVLGGGLVFYQINSHPSTSTPSPTPVETANPSPSFSPTASPSATPKPTAKATSKALIDCVGPDGKHSQKTKADCDAFLKAWATPTPKPTASSSSSSSSSSGGCSIGSVNVGISPDSGPVVGDALISVSVNSSSCASSYSNQKVLSQGSSTVNFSGILPGTYNITALYHGHETHDSFSLGSGETVSKNIGVSN